MAEATSLEVVTGGALEALQRGEVESQIDVAKRYPRSLEKFKQREGRMGANSLPKRSETWTNASPQFRLMAHRQ